MIDFDDDTHEIATYDLTSVLYDEPQLRRIVETLRTHVSAYFVCEAAYLPSLVPQEAHVEPMIIISSRRIQDGWAATYNNVDVTVDAFDRTYDDSMSYLSWSTRSQSVGIKIEEIQNIIDKYPRAQTIHIVWVTDTELTVDSLDVYEHCHDKFDIADKLYRLSRHIPDDEYISAKLGSFPPPLSPDERCCIDGEGQPLYIACAVTLDTK